MEERRVSGILTDDREGVPRCKAMGISGLPIVLLCIHVVALIAMAAWHSPVSGELDRLRAGYDHWKTLDFRRNPGNPPLNDLIAAAPIVMFTRPDSRPVHLDNDFQTKELLSFVFLGRLTLIPFSVLGGWICFKWSRELYGNMAGLLVLILWCFDPLILSHGAMITGDLCATSVGITSARTYWLWMSSLIIRSRFPGNVSSDCPTTIAPRTFQGEFYQMTRSSTPAKSTQKRRSPKNPPAPLQVTAPVQVTAVLSDAAADAQKLTSAAEVPPTRFVGLDVHKQQSARRQDRCGRSNDDRQ